MGVCQIRLRLQLHAVCGVRQSLDCVALAVSLSGFYYSHHLICCTNWTVMSISSLLWGMFFSGLWIAGNSCWGEQILHLKFVQYFFKRITCFTNKTNAYLSSVVEKHDLEIQMDGQTHTTTTICLWGSSHQGIINTRCDYDHCVWNQHHPQSCYWEKVPVCDFT